MPASPPPAVTAPAGLPRPWSAPDFAAAVLDWFERHGRRDLPWQVEPSAYRVWISEVMLQQTRVAVAIPYFERFMARFPDLATLAAADLDQVLQHWAGLGYYARARNLHRAAQRIQIVHDGRFPATLAEALALPGIGRSTAGAVLSLAYGQRQPLLDGNVKRVLARCFLIEGWPGQAGTQAALWRQAEALTPAARVGAYNQAMMDLGATVCTRAAPACARCPLAAGCRALASGRTRACPAPKPRRPRPARQARLLIARDPRGALFVRRRPPSGLWGGLWAFPELEAGADAGDWCRRQFGVDVQRLENWPCRRHSFTHFELDFEPMLVELNRCPTRLADAPDERWIDPIEARAPSLAMPAPLARLLREIAALAPDLARPADRALPPIPNQGDCDEPTGALY